MKNKALYLLFALFACIPSFAQILDPVKWNVELSKITADGKATITYEATIDKGWHMYSTKEVTDGPVPTTFMLTDTEGVKIESDINPRSRVIEQFEPAFNVTVGWYEDKATFQQQVKISDKDNFTLIGSIRYMTCNNQNCLPPTTYEFDLSQHNAVEKKKNNDKVAVTTPSTEKKTDTEADQKPKISFSGISQLNVDSTNSASITSAVSSENREERVDTWGNVVEEMKAYGNIKTDDGKDSLWKTFLTCLLGGLIAVITPCVWPNIIMTVNFFLKRAQKEHDKAQKNEGIIAEDDQNKKKKYLNKAKWEAVAYGFSIIIIYVGLGLIITALGGADSMNLLSTNAIFNIVIFALLVLFSISFFGGFNLALPSTWSTKIGEQANKSSGVFSILFMALTLVIVSFSCTGPIIGTLLVDLSVNGSLLAPTIGMLGFAIALAIPFTLFAFFPTLLQDMPRKGGWMNSIKVLLGFFELAFSLKFLSMADLAYGWHIMDRELFLVIWIVIFMMAGLYLLGKIQFAGDDEDVKVVSVPRFFLSTFCFSMCVYMLPGLWGAPLKAISAFVPPLSTQDFNLYNDKVSATFKDYDDALRYAEMKELPVVVDFTGHACVNCRKMESSVWSDPRVKALLTEEYVLVSLYVDDRTELPKTEKYIENGKEIKVNTVGEKWSYLQRSKFGANAQPYYCLLDYNGKPINHPMGFSENSSEFIDFLRTGLRNYKKQTK